MNPPAALHGAMSRDRKPFTYTPGGLDLSEIKSSRMAARLMRNAMNEGVPEVPKQSIQPQPMSSTPIAVPNFNCLPVQVFPTFNLPANPKSLLRTRSNPAPPRDLPVQKAPLQAAQFVNNSMTAGQMQYDTFNKNTAPYSQANNNRPVSMFEYGPPPNINTLSYENDVYNTALPEISYDAEYFRALPKNNVGNGITRNGITTNINYADNAYKSTINPFEANYYGIPVHKPQIENIDATLAVTDTTKFDTKSEINFKPEINNEVISLPYIQSENFGNHLEDVHKKSTTEKDEINTTIKKNIASENKYTAALESAVPSIEASKNNNTSESFVLPLTENTESLNDENSKLALDYSSFAPEMKVSVSFEDLEGPDNLKKEVKVVEKQVVVSKNSVENQNGANEQNGDSEVEAVIKLPSKRSAAKTETKVQVTKKTLPDGSTEEVKKTITTTTIDGKTEIKTKTETTIIPKENDEDEVEDIEEEEEEGENVEMSKENVSEEPVKAVIKKSTEDIVKPKENGQENIIKTEERSEITSTSMKKIVVVQDEEDDEEEVVEEEVVDDPEPVTFVIKKPEEKPAIPQKEETDEEAEKGQEEIEKDKIEKEENLDTDVEEKVQTTVEKEEINEEVEEEEEYEEAEESTDVEVSKTATESKEKDDADSETATESKEKDDADSETIQVETEDIQKENEKPTEVSKEPPSQEINDDKQELTQEAIKQKQEVVVEKQEIKQEKPNVQEEVYTIKVEKVDAQENKVPLREPSVPLEKVEDVEIKPIGLGDYLTRTSTEKTEILTNIADKPSGLLQEINRIENIVTINRTTKTLDRAYEDITQQGIPTLKTYFTPHVDNISTSPQNSRPYQPVYAPEPTTERRHSLLLERISVDRQLPSDIYQNNYQYSNQTIEQQKQWSQEPQAEVLTVSNVKPSQISNQQWYQQKENGIYNNVAPSPQPAQPSILSWNQPKPQTQPLYQPQPEYQHSPQPQYQAPPQPQYQEPPPPQYQPTVQPQPRYQSSYSDNHQEKSSYQNTYSQNTYAPQLSSWATNTKPLSPIPTIITPSQPSPYSNSYLSKDSSESYQKTTQNHSTSSYVPPPWEQDSNYVAPVTPQDYYQPPPQTSSFSPAPNTGWNPNIPTGKFSKPSPTAYIPPKPNQSFVAPVTHAVPPKVAGRKTYYSEYERRYISVPESTYIPGENKFQHQPDPSPAYYYDNNEPVETLEPQWRRELREFTEKSQSYTTTETSIKPPWEAETKFVKAQEPSYTPTPTWSQTVRPQSWRERSFESEFVSQEWPKTNTLGRGRPLSSYGKETVPERTRGVSVDRYNPNSYQAPVAAEHPPVQTHTHIPPAPHATGYHNPNVPAYHARASAEPREQISYQQPRNVREARASPFQSRSFKYLQWITGTED